MLIFKETVILPVGARESTFLPVVRRGYRRDLKIVPDYRSIRTDAEGELFAIDLEFYE